MLLPSWVDAHVSFSTHHSKIVKKKGILNVWMPKWKFLFLPSFDLAAFGWLNS